MSMIGCYKMISEKELEELKAGKLTCDTFLFNEVNEEDESTLDIDKAWHAIHYILSGKVWKCGESPCSRAVLGGVPVDDNDLGYGPATYFTAGDVKVISESLQKVSEQEFKAAFDLKKMADMGVYPVMNGENPDEFLGYILPYFKEVQELYRKAAAEGNALLFWLS